MLLFWATQGKVHGQCGPNVPSFVVDLSLSPTATWTSPWVQRQDNCCGTTPPDVCVEFVLTLHPTAQGIIFDICDGAVPGGSMFYQVGCGPSASVGQPLCLNGAGPHYITFCKPGNNTNIYCITSVPAPSAGPDIGINDGCTGTLTTSGFAPGSVLWTSIAPGAQGAYDNFLGCNTCGTTPVTSTPGPPPFVDYLVCGNALSPCSSVVYCDTVRVAFFSTLSASISPPFPVVCFGGTGVTLTCNGSGGTPPYTYLWSTGATTPSIQVTTPGTYTVQLADTSGCPGTSASIDVVGFSQPITANAGADITICNGSLPVQLNGSVTGVTGGQWSGAGQFLPHDSALTATYMPTPSEIAAGQFTLTLTTTGNNGCPGDQDNVQVVLSSSFMNAQVLSYDVACHGDQNGSAAYVPALPGQSYQWSDPGGQTTATAFGLGAGTYSVQVTDALGCDTTMNVTIAQPPPLSIDTIQVIAPTCAGAANGGANALVSGGTPGYTYQWSSNAGGQNTPSAGNLGNGTYIVVVTDANGCMEQASVSVTGPPALTLSATVPDTVCVNDPVLLTAQASGGTGGLVIEWDGIGFGTSLLYSFPADQTVQVTVTDANGCSGPVLSFPVTVLDLNNATLLAYGDTTVCPGGFATVRAEVLNYAGPVNYTWPQLGLTGPGPYTIPVTMSQTLDVIATDACAEQLWADVVLGLEVPPTVQLPPLIAEGCAPLEVQFPPGPSGQFSYLWDLGDGSTSTSPAPLHTYQAGTYNTSLTVTTPAGCSATSTGAGAVIVHALPQPAFIADPWTTSIDAPTVQFTDQTGGSIMAHWWEFGDGMTSDLEDPDHTYSSVGEFPVTLWVEDQNGCTNEVVRTVTITPNYELIIPNVFTPDANGSSGGYYDPLDLSNDVFYPFVKYVSDFRMRIFDRWGELIFETNELARGWDGYYRGQLSQQDAYVYQVWVRFVDGKELERTGDVTLMR